MKTNGRIQDLLSTVCANDIEYGHRVIWPLLDYLAVPSAARRPEFQIENPFNDKQLRVDFLIHVGDIPMVTIEGEPHARQFDEGYRQAKNYSKSFRPRQRDCPMREMTVPFVLVAAGSRAETYRAVAHGINVDYELIEQDGKPAFLEWTDILAEAAKIPAFGAAAEQLDLFGARPGPVSEAQQVLKADAARQFFSDLYSAIGSARALRDKEDRSIVLFNRIIDLARHGQASKIDRTCRKEGLTGRATDRVMEALSWYERQMEANEFSGAAVARGYRNFLVQPAGRGGHYFFTGTTQHRPVITGGQVRYRKVARYFTPTEIIQQMVRLAAPKSDERVIDMTCGGGGFLAECVDYIAQNEGEPQARRFLKQRLVGIDDDPFCVSCSRELLTFMYPDCADDIHVYLHNCLYRRAPAESEVREDREAERHLADGRYDLVIGNPPGNDKGQHLVPLPLQAFHVFQDAWSENGSEIFAGAHCGPSGPGCSAAGSGYGRPAASTRADCGCGWGSGYGPDSGDGPGCPTRGSGSGAPPASAHNEHSPAARAGTAENRTDRIRHAHQALALINDRSASLTASSVGNAARTSGSNNARLVPLR
ncbi:MAG TPA: N-6 DNA methylase [Pirellulales bacterium]|nr:N-6 DNA methylase [Pirellulales bacterium]